MRRQEADFQKAARLQLTEDNPENRFKTTLLSEKYFQVRRMVFQGNRTRRARLTRHAWCVRRTKGNYLFERRLVLTSQMPVIVPRPEPEVFLREFSPLVPDLRERRRATNRTGSGAVG